MAPFTRINGEDYSHSSCEITVAGKVRPFIKELSYTDTLEPGEVRGTKAQRLSRTRGEYKCEASLTLGKGAAQELLQEFGNGYMEKVFDVIITRQEPELATIVDTLARCRIKKIESGTSSGSDGHEVKMDLDVMYILWNGLSPIKGLIKG